MDVQADRHVSSFQIFNQVLENEQKVYVSAHAASCDVSNNPDVEEPDESSPVHYHLLIGRKRDVVKLYAYVRK